MDTLVRPNDMVKSLPAVFVKLQCTVLKVGVSGV